MKKFINRVDHVVYISKLKNIDEHVGKLEAITGAHLERFERHDLGALICVDWSAGLEVVAPLPRKSEMNCALYDRLDSHGEGPLAVVYAVDDLEAHKNRLESQGIEVGALLSGDPSEPWYGRIFLRERMVPAFMGTWMYLSQIDYDDDLIRFVNVENATHTP